MNSLLTLFAAAVLPLLAIALTVMAHRRVMKIWRAKIDTELAQALSTWVSPLTRCLSTN
ncbi:hypothetical protein IRZ53_21270 [Pseudomonas fulva]|uniref:hypothetical protein n=1 Tax=Pseudomonas fulva TaxID=47880 RepID=UPI0018AADD88|nr:hypothetical protein [Pseudomonas fulva]MBF8676956.1 hypothetical protein [Pseudomonas fulva]MBF8699319.1 hypothetical protein [Pseudomonas fulva]